MTLVAIPPSTTTDLHENTRTDTMPPSTTATVVSTQPSSPPSSKRTMVTLPSTSAATKKPKKSSKTGGTKSHSSSSLSSSAAVRLSTGRWTAEEHALFLEGLESYGKGWKQIASLIKSRTVVQIRTHAQKYFQKLAKNQERQQQQQETSSNKSSSGTKRRRNSSKKTGPGSEPKTTFVPVPPAHPQRVPSYSDTTLPVTALEDPLFRFEASPHAPADVPVIAPSSNSAWSASSSAVAPPPAGKDVSSWYPTSSTPPPSGDGVQVNEVARQAGVANPIVLPEPNPSVLGAGSPTAVTDLWAAPPSSSGDRDVPSWCNSKHIDAIDNLLEADTLDWLLETPAGDLPPPPPAHGTAPESSFGGLPKAPVLGAAMPPPPPAPVVTPCHTMTEVMPPAAKRQKVETTTAAAPVPVVVDDDHLNGLFDSAMEEQDFVATILDEDHNCDGALPPLA